MTPLRVVIVDDEEPARNRLRELLEDCRGELPHSIAGEAANGVEGLQIVAAAEAEVVLVDIHMPEMSGIEVLKTINAEGLKCVVIVLSAMADQTYREQCLALGASYVFDKTSEFKKVIEVLLAL